MKLALLLAFALALLPAPHCDAHTRSASYSSWEISGTRALVRVRIPMLELARLPPQLFPAGPDPAGLYLAERLVLWSGETLCQRKGAPLRLQAAEGWRAYEWQLVCSSAAAFRIETRLLLEVAPSHLHFARLRTGPETPVLERVLTRAEPRWSLSLEPERSETTGATQPRGTSLAGYIALGIEHILTGYDHLAFVLGLLLLARTIGEVAALVTSFTIAHSVTLGLAVLGVVHPDAAAVEALIGYSIALVAAENVWLLAGRGPVLPLIATAALAALAVLAWLGSGSVPPAAFAGLTLFTFCHFSLLRRATRPERLRAAVAFGFGLVHGFGFAGILAEMELPTARLAPALFGFNIGVEIGQLGIVLAVWPLLRALARPRAERVFRLVAETGSAAICGLGLFWFATRTFG